MAPVPVSNAPDEYLADMCSPKASRDRGGINNTAHLSGTV